MLLAVKFSEFIAKTNVIIGIIVAAIGIAGLIIAPRLTAFLDKTETANKSSKSYVTCKAVGIVCLLLGMILIALPF